ncbi:hypothetical protein CU098_004176, partial [Rhizopus stolonifer]
MAVNSNKDGDYLVFTSSDALIKLWKNYSTRAFWFEILVVTITLFERGMYHDLKSHFSLSHW